MKKVHWEVLAITLFVVATTFFLYRYLLPMEFFWSAQNLWSAILALGWVIVTIGYYHQGWMIQKGGGADHVSLLLPSAVFIVQCVLFIKGVFYNDWSLVSGSVMVNSGVLFSIYQIVRHRYFSSGR